MSKFEPADNTLVAAYGPPEYFETQAEDSGSDEKTDADSFFSKLIAIFKKIFELIKSLFQ